MMLTVAWHGDSGVKVDLHLLLNVLVDLEGGVLLAVQIVPCFVPTQHDEAEDHGNRQGTAPGRPFPVQWLCLCEGVAQLNLL